MDTLIVFSIVALPYTLGGLGPVLSPETMDLHYGKHYQNYVDKTNKLVKGSPFEGYTLPEIVQAAPYGALLNNAGQAYNHELYFLELSPNPRHDKPQGDLAKAIDTTFGSFDKFKEAMTDSALALFGSGWTWLFTDATGKIGIGNYPNGENPWKQGLVPLLGIDVWEHAYYMDYQNRRADYLKAFWDIINWDEVDRRYNRRCFNGM